MQNAVRVFPSLTRSFQEFNKTLLQRRDDTIIVLSMSDTPLNLQEAREHLQSCYAQTVCLRTLKNWIRHGCRGVRLRGKKVGLRWTTSVEAIAEFVNGTTEASGVAQFRSPAEVSRETELALRELKQDGYLRKKKSPLHRQRVQ